MSHPLILLLLCCLAVAAARRRSGALDRYEASIRAFEAADRSHPQRPGGTLFVGSSTFTLWSSLEATFADLRAINRGFGGATIPEVTHYIERIVVPYKPARVVFYAGTNDIAWRHSAQQVAEDFAAFVTRLHTSLPGTPVFFVSLVAGPRRQRFATTFHEANERVRQYVGSNAALHFIDVRPVMLTDAGQLDRTLYRWDRLHMNERGQARWVPVLRQALS